MSGSVLFPCDRPLVRNYYRPPAASRLAPGDVRALAAMGDFAAAGTGARAAELPEAGTDYRGASFVTGILGQKCLLFLLTNLTYAQAATAPGGTT